MKSISLEMDIGIRSTVDMTIGFTTNVKIPRILNARAAGRGISEIRNLKEFSIILIVSQLKIILTILRERPQD